MTRINPDTPVDAEARQENFNAQQKNADQRQIAAGRFNVRIDRNSCMLSLPFFSAII
jgi:hypothetical protein